MSGKSKHIFQNAPVPHLKAGSYTLEAESKLHLKYKRNDENGNSQDAEGKANDDDSLTFGLFSPRFGLEKPGFVYPPDQASGEFPKDTLPKLVFDNVLYPYSRNLFKKESQQAAPFCVLITLHESAFAAGSEKLPLALPPLLYVLEDLEGAAGSTKESVFDFEQLQKQTKEDISVFGFNHTDDFECLTLHEPLHERWKAPKELKLSKKEIEAGRSYDPEPANQPLSCLYLKKEMAEKWLPSANELNQLIYSEYEEGEEESAVILSRNVIREPGIYRCFLLSLEHRYDADTQKLVLPSGAANDHYLGFTILNQWQCDVKQPSNPGPVYLKQELTELAVGSFEYQPQPMLHRLRTGKEGYSYYTYPLWPVGKVQDLPDRFGNQRIERSDQLVLNRNDNYDVTYASAWELGRLIGLNMTALSQSLLQYKETDPHSAKEWKTALEKVKELFSLEEVLANIPIHYLLTDAWQPGDAHVMSFKLDPWWLIQLLKGLFSLGDESYLEKEKKAMFFKLMPDQNWLLNEEIHGFIFHSRLLVDFPHLRLQPKDGNVKPLYKRTIDEKTALYFFRGKTLKSLEVGVPFKNYGNVLSGLAKVIDSKGKDTGKVLGKIVNEQGLIDFESLRKVLKDATYSVEDAATGKALALQIQQKQPKYYLQLKN